jgi:hypothetical protein
LQVLYIEHSTLGAEYNMAAANIETEIVFPNLKKLRHQKMNHNETECMLEIKAFADFGDYALELLPKVIKNIWLHYNINNIHVQKQILKHLNLDHLLGVETKIS